MNEATKRFFARLYLQQASSDDYVDWAIACLEDGFDSKNLRMLAAAEKPYYPSEIEERFRRSLNELGWNYPSEKESLLSYAKELAQRTVSGEFNPITGCSKIYQVSLSLEYPEELKNWLYLDEGYDPETNEWLYDPYQRHPANKKQKWFEAIIREAKKLAESNY